MIVRFKGIRHFYFPLIIGISRAINFRFHIRLTGPVYTIRCIPNSNGNSVNRADRRAIFSRNATLNKVLHKLDENADNGRDRVDGVRIMEKPRDGRKLSRVKDLGAATSKGEAREGRERVKDEK